ncbi:tRNA 2-selenouridine(34) synthase MnmH [Fusobacterium sp. MFO224]|uniref:tRNA 2-selenouridine(34) synthase MnmH n=1 Tax=Fusobacterium sp. MFO224 TaxID=3378070 RepID=UPI003851A889
MREISFDKVLKLKNYILIDARSPKEFKKQGIPGAVNIPTLLDDERAEVGTVYVQESKEKAKEIGVQKISKRLPEIFKQVNELSKKYNNLIFYCARGGMRSGSLEVLFNTLGFKTMKLQGGYKGYREYILKNMEEVNKNKEYIVIHGRTGEGKTKILEKLENKGYSVLNLEKLADHKGSFFGGVCEKREQSQKRFDGEIFHRLTENKKGYFLVESESKRIGNIYVPESVYGSIVKGKHLFVSTSMENRVNIIMEDYANATISELEECLLKVARYISKERYERYHNLLMKGELAKLSEILMDEYYDPLYDVGINKYNYDLNINYKKIEEAVEDIITYLKENNYED